MFREAFNVRRAAGMPLAVAFWVSSIGFGCGSDSQGSVVRDASVIEGGATIPANCQEWNGCDVTFDELVRSCAQDAADGFTPAARAWRSNIEPDADAPFQPSYTFLVREVKTSFETFMGADDPEQTVEVFRIVVERGMVTEITTQSGTDAAPSGMQTIEELFVLLARVHCVKGEGSTAESYEVSASYDAMLGFPEEASYQVRFDESGYSTSWRIECLSLGVAKESTCPIPAIRVVP